MTTTTTLRAAAISALFVVASTTVLAAQTIAITGGRVFPVSGPPIENGTVLIRDGRIAAVGANVTIPADAQRVDAAGRWVTPGLINGATQMGIYEVGQVQETRDAMARGREGLAAAFTVWEGINPASVLIAPARNEGITTVVIAPGGGQIFSGQAAMIDLVDGTARQMIVRAPVAMLGQIGNAQRAGLASRGEVIGRLREVIDDARTFQRNRRAFDENRMRALGASRLDLEALIPVLEGRLPLALQVDRRSDIEAAIELAREFNFRLIIVGGAESWEVADQLAAARVPVMLGAMMNIPGTFTTLGSRQEAAGILRGAGVQVVIIGNAGGGDEEAFNVRNLKQQAGNAVAYGMSWNDALRAVTLTPAEVFGVSDRYGSLQAGRVANVVVWSGDPFEFGTVAEHVYVRGQRLMTPTRQDELTERYRQSPPNYRRP